MTELRLYFPFEPKAIQSARFAKVGKFMKSYQPKEVQSYKGMIAYSFLQQVGGGFVPTENPVVVTRLWFVFPMNKTTKKSDIAIVENWEKKEGEPGFMYDAPIPLYKTTRPDLADNLSKGMMDALTGLLWKDDSQIVAMHDVMKCYGLKSRIELWVEYA
jgi:Holliday junction resolvase RusA-like endonuclease